MKNLAGILNIIGLCSAAITVLTNYQSWMGWAITSAFWNAAVVILWFSPEKKYKKST